MARFNLRLINSLDYVRPGLFISSAQMEQEPESLEGCDITHVLQVRQGPCIIVWHQAVLYVCKVHSSGCTL